MSNFLTRALIESDSNYVIERSLRFNAASSQYLTRTPSVAGNRRLWTYSYWGKLGQLGTHRGLLATPNMSFGFHNSDAFFLTIAGVGTQVTSALFRDPNAWYHIVVTLDTAQATAANRFKVTINNVNYTFTSNIVALNTDYEINSTAAHQIGTTGVSGGTTYNDGYGAEINFVNAQALSSTSFGEVNQSTDQMVAKKYTGAYGTNGFYLDFKDGTSTTTLGYDKSGNNNHWTLTNFTRSAGVNDCWMLDVPAGNGSASAVQPSGNYAVLNPLDRTGVFPTKANLNWTNATANNYMVRSSVVCPHSGLFYAEVVMNSAVASGIGIYFGLATPTAALVALSANAWLFGCDSQNRYWNQTVNNAVTGTGAAGQVLQVAYDATNNRAWLGKNDSWLDSSLGFTGNPSAGTNPTVTGLPSGLMFILDCYNSDASANFGQRSFAYTPPTGFKALCTANLPTPTIKKSSDHFKVQLSTGANIKTDSEALFTNELEWIKDRANANNHQLIDSVRGSNAVLQSNTTAAETTYTAPSGSSVGWVWRASDSAAVTNNVGSISSQVSANPTAGFSIVTYTGTGANATVGHGLGIAPKMIIVKRRNGGADYWDVMHQSANGGNGHLGALFLQRTDAYTASSTEWNNTPPTSSVFSIGSSTSSNANTGTYVAYCFAEIAGYSKFGSYTGNGSADGPFVYLGFKPALFMCKRIDAVEEWLIWDNKRSPTNEVGAMLYPNLSNAEISNANSARDFLSNGFKIRGAATLSGNASGGTYIYMAFAESPINYASAR